MAWVRNASLAFLISLVAKSTFFLHLETYSYSATDATVDPTGTDDNRYLSANDNLQYDVVFEDRGEDASSVRSPIETPGKPREELFNKEEAVKSRFKAQAELRRKKGLAQVGSLQKPLAASSFPTNNSTKFAYAFFLGGVTATNKHHLGHLYNILVSVQILRDSGSTADMVLLAHSVEANTTLPANQQTMLQKLGVQIRYTPDTGLDSTTYFETVPLEKFRILDWTEYSRVLFIESDIMPHCNLDYFFENSVKGVLQENVLVSIGRSPASPNFFLVKPEEGSFQKFLQMMASLPYTTKTERGIGKVGHFTYPRGDWTNLFRTEHPPSIKLAILGDPWDFPGQDSDAGLFYAYMRTQGQHFSMIVGKEEYASRGRYKVSRARPNPLRKHSCQPNMANVGKINHQTYHFKRPLDTKYLSPKWVGPYWDIAQWEHDTDRPWNLREQPAAVARKVSGAVERWFQVLTHLDIEHQLDLGLVDTSHSDWNYVPSTNHPAVVPSGGLKIQLMQEWAQKQVDAEYRRKWNLAMAPSRQLQAMTVSSTTTTNPLKKKRKQKRAFMCITGQLERLELTSKLEKLLLPLQKRGGKLDVALVLTGGTSTYTNQDQSHNTQNHAPFYANFSAAVQELTNHGINVVTKDTYEKVKHPPFRGQYYDLLRKEQGGFRTDEAQRARSLNHARIFESYGRCLAYAREAVSRAAEKVDDSQFKPTLENYYDVFFRIRDDIGFETPLPNSVFNSLIQPSPGSLQVTGCRSWYGMNDRFASVSPDVVQLYFTRPYHNYLSDRFPPNRVFNPESYLMTTYLDAGIHVNVNQDLKGLLKVVMTEEGEAAFAPSDVQKRFCLEEDPYREHLIELYGWNF